MIGLMDHVSEARRNRRLPENLVRGLVALLSVMVLGREIDTAGRDRAPLLSSAIGPKETARRARGSLTRSTIMLARGAGSVHTLAVSDRVSFIAIQFARIPTSGLDQRRELHQLPVMLWRVLD
jgi:hypothetical protein